MPLFLTFLIMQNKIHITFIPVGGLANRMKAINSAITLADKVEATLEIIWFRGWELNCPFHKLFVPIEDGQVRLKEATTLDYIIHDRPRNKNLFIPKLFQKILFDKIMYETETFQQALNKFNFVTWCGNKTNYIAAFCDFCLDTNRRMFEMFEPAEELKERIRQNVNLFNAHTVGVHIRRTDHAMAIEKSPTELFIKRMKEEIEQHQDTLFYLATDSEHEKNTLKEIFGNRIITSPYPADRNSIQGMQDAVVELYTLASTSHIIGSVGSTYATTAAKIGDIGYENVSIENS